MALHEGDVAGLGAGPLQLGAYPREPDDVAGFWNVMRIYPEESLAVVVMGNTTSYDHESVCDAVAGVPWQ